METKIIWAGAGWYGAIQRRDFIEIVRIVTDAGRDDYQQASRDAYGQAGTPDWYDSEEEFYQS